MNRFLTDIPDPLLRDRDERYQGRAKHLRKARPMGTEKFSREDFTYDKSSDTYTCPNLERLKINARASPTTRGIYRKYRITTTPATPARCEKNASVKTQKTAP